jgi:hypothetical protein
MPNVILQFHIFMTRYVYMFTAFIRRYSVMRSAEVEFLDEIRPKSLKSFPP